jgi:dTDP-4-amino-4,6-dideoxygalactose transaminase
VSERPFIPFHRPSIGQPEIDAVVAALQSGWLTTGPRTAQFETEFREYVRAPYALAVNSGTAALHLALAALGLGPGDEVITTPLTFCATVNIILHVGATPVLADIGADGNIDPNSIRRRISPQTKALLPVHYGGAPCDMDSIWSIAREHGLFVVEDAAHATGAYYGSWPIGAGDPASGLFSDAAAFSFYATKNLATGEGGMVTCHRATLLERMRILCLHGISKDAWNRYTEKGNWYYEVAECGFKYNLSDIQSAIGIEQLRKQEALLRMRAAHARFYNESFEEIEELETPRDSSLGRHAWHLYPLRLNLDRLTITRAEFIDRLRQRGIGASVHFIPIPLHPAYSGRAELAANHVPRAMALYERLVSLPLYPDLSRGDLAYIAASVKSIVHRASRRRIAAVPAA